MEIIKLDVDEQLYSSKLSEIKDFRQLIVYLESLINSPLDIIVNWDGTVYFKAEAEVIERVNGMSIVIYSREHPPPHFHVRSAQIDASLLIEDCTKLHGDISDKNLRKIQHWHSHAKPFLIEKWNNSRPTNCIVGKYEE